MSMTRRERLAAALRGEPVDRPPVALWRHFPVDDQDPEQRAQSGAAFPAHLVGALRLVVAFLLKRTDLLIQPINIP